MRRMPNKFYAAVKTLRDQYGSEEYSRDVLVPGVIGLIREHLTDEQALWKDAAIDIIDRFDRDDEKTAGGLFDEDGHVKLGETQRIKRSAMTMNHLLRRKSVIDTNRMAQDQAWARETGWLNDEIEALQGFAPGTKRAAVSRAKSA